MILLAFMLFLLLCEGVYTLRM